MRKAFKLTLAIAFCLALQAGSFGSLISHYQFDGDLKDSISGTTATAVGTTPATMFVTGPEGVPGQAVDLGGTDWWINCGSTLDTGTTALTVSAWIYDEGTINTGTDYYFGGIVMRDGQSSGNWGLRRYSMQKTISGTYYDLPGRAQIIIGDSNQTSATTASNAVPGGEWVLLTATYQTYQINEDLNGHIVKLYVNGQPSAESTYEDVYDAGQDDGILEAIDGFGSTKEILIGYDNSRADAAGTFDGLIADVRIYNEALDATAVAGLVNPVPEPSTLAMLGMGLLAGLGFFVRRR